MLKTTLDQVPATRPPWLERYGVPEDTARQRVTELKDLLTATAQEARDAQDEEIRNSPILESAVSTARSALRSAFHAADIAGTLLAWTGNATDAMPPGEIGGLSVFLSASAARSSFIDGGDPAGVGRWLGTNLAQAGLQHVLAAATSGTEAHAITAADAAVKVREAITQVRASARQENHGQRQEDAARVVVIIPDTPYDLKKDIGVTDTAPRLQVGEGRPPEYETLYESLGVVGNGPARNLVGLIDDTPVIRTHRRHTGYTDARITKHLVILDAARLRWLTPRPSANEEHGDPGLVLLTERADGQQYRAAAGPGSAHQKRGRVGRGIGTRDIDDSVVG